MNWIRPPVATSAAPPPTWHTDVSKSARDSGSSAFHRGWAPGAVHRMVVSSAGKTGCLWDRVRSLWLDRLWLLLEARGGLDSATDTRGIQVDRGSLALDPLAWLSCWVDETVDVEAPVRLICITMLVIISATKACEGT